MLYPVDRPCYPFSKRLQRKLSLIISLSCRGFRTLLECLCEISQYDLLRANFRAQVFGVVLEYICVQIYNDMYHVVFIYALNKTVLETIHCIPQCSHEWYKQGWHGIELRLMT